MSEYPLLYTPAAPPQNTEQLPAYLEAELQRVSIAIRQIALGYFPKTHVEPDKPRDGMVRYADGTNWNPGGGGAGIYWYNGSTWTKL